MKSRSLMCAALLACSPAAWADVFLDQSQLEHADYWLAVGSDVDQKLAQTFRAGIDGRLAMVKLAAGCNETLPDVVTVSLQTLDAAGAPSGVVLASVSVAASALPTYPVSAEGVLHAFPLDGARVEAGQFYAIVVVANPGASCALRVSGNDNPYPDGELYFDARPNPPGWVLDPGTPDRDFVFQTYIDTGPEGDGLCDFRTASGPNDWVPADVPVCGCLRDPGLASERCWFRLPELVLVREIPRWPKEKFAARWSIVPLVDQPLPVEIELLSRSGKLVGERLKLDGGKPLESALAEGWYWIDGPAALDATRVIVRDGNGAIEFDTRRLPEP